MPSAKGSRVAKLLKIDVRFQTPQATPNFHLLADFGIEATESYWSIIPKQVWYVIACAVFSWTLRGQEMSLPFPATCPPLS